MTMDAAKRISEIFDESIALKRRVLNENLQKLLLAVSKLAETIKGGNKILLFGNGGSAADAQHIAAEFVNRFLIERPPLPAIALTTDSSILTAVANDYGYEQLFEKQILALGNSGDVAWGISTSGESKNVIRGLRAAGKKHMFTMSFGGPPESAMSEHSDVYFPVYGASTPRIQEIHTLMGHTLVEILDETLFGNR